MADPRQQQPSVTDFNTGSGRSGGIFASVSFICGASGNTGSAAEAETGRHEAENAAVMHFGGGGGFAVILFLELSAVVLFGSYPDAGYRLWGVYTVWQ